MNRKALSILILSILLISFMPITQALAVQITGLSAMSGDKGDTITVNGDGVTAGVNVEVYWDAVKAWDGEKGLLNSTETNADGSFEVDFDVPEAVNGDHYVWVKDTGTGETYGGAAVMNSMFTVDAKLSLDPDSGLPEDVILMKGYGFGDEVEIVSVTFDAVPMTADPDDPETNSLGTWSAELEIPDLAYGDYTVYVEDEDGNWATATFTIGASIELGDEVGPTGKVVMVEGRGFRGTEIDSVTLDGIDCKITDEDDKELDDGEFTLWFVVPSVADAEEEYDVVVSDDGVDSADAEFEVDGLAEIKLTPAYGVQGGSIGIEGWNFTQIDGEEVTLWFGAFEVEDFETDADGEFSGSFTIPALASGVYDAVATQDDSNIMSEDEEFKVGLMIIILSDTSGSTGTGVTITGAGFTPLMEWNATMGGEDVAEGDVEADGTLSELFYVPTLDLDTYTVTVFDEDTEIEVTAEFEVTAKTMAEADPMEAPNDYEVDLSGSYFADVEGSDLEFVIYNSTEEWEMTVYNNSEPEIPAELGEDGMFEAYWTVPDDDEISIGSYTINVTDGEGLMAQIPFEIVSKLVSIDPRKSAFNIGNTVAFDIESSFKKPDSYIKVWDSDGVLAWETDPLEDESWIAVGYNVVVPYFKQTANGNPMVLEADAELGTWTWTWYDDEDEEIDSGSFTVNPASEALLSEQIEALSEDVSGLAENFDDLSGDVSGVKSDVAGVKSDVASVKSDFASVKSDVSGISGKADAAKSAADSAKSAADAAKSAADDAKTASSGLSTLVYGAIGASLIAALAAIVALMQISRKIA
jgi:hypothetical protein